MKDFISELLQIALGNRKEFSRQLTIDEWEELYSACELQLVLGFAFSGIERLPEEQLPPSKLFEKWKDEAQKEQEERERMAEICRKACETHERNGFNSCVLMPRLGQVRGDRLEVRDKRLEVSDGRLEVRGERSEVRDGRLEVRDKRLERPSKSPLKGDFYSRIGRHILEDTQSSTSLPTGEGGGRGRGGDPKDIDILCWSKEKKDGKRMIVEYVNFLYVVSTKHIKPKVVRHHVNFETGNIPLEVRFKFSYFNSPLHDRRFLAWVEEKTFSVTPQRGKDGYPVPSNTFNAVYQLIHLYRKLFCEGIRLGHLYDYYMVLRSLPKSEHEEVMRVICRLGMKKFATAVMYVMQTVFGMPDEFLFCKPNPRNGSFVISITMQAGEYTRAIERTRMLKHLGRIGHHLYWLKRNRPFLTQYPAEVCFELYRRMRG